MTHEAEIRVLLAGWEQAIAAKNVTGSSAGYAADVVIFDLVEPLQHTGLDGLRRRLASWFDSFDGPIEFEHRELFVAAADSVAFAHCLNHVRGTAADGSAVDMWWRSTLCLRQSSRGWQVTHAHASVPFDMATGQASVALKP